MTILLQNKKTLRYVEGHTRWTTHAEHAQEFGTGLEAICFCLTHDIIDMQILGRFADARMDFSVAVTDLRGS